MKSLLFVLVCALFICTIGSMASAAVTGAVWTTDVTGTVNRNIYNEKCDVYLNGGPLGHQAGLPDGTYYYQVTNPSGDMLLSTKPLAERTVVVSGGWVQNPVQLCDFADTPNEGGEYKVWITLVSDYEANGAFMPELSKTDNFKVKSSDPDGDPVYGSIGGYKFYDANTNHELDPLDAPIPCWVIQLYEVDENNIESLVATVRTDANGAYRFPDLEEGIYIVREVMPYGNWIQTAPLDSASDLNPLDNVAVIATGGAYTVQLVAVDNVVPNADGVNFGNVYLTPGCNGYTLGYWSNKNGQAVLSGNDPAWRNLLNSLYLVKANGSPFEVGAGSFSTAVSGFRTWILNATATNMAYMLSAQLAATTLDVSYKGLNPDATVFLPNSLAVCSGVQFVKIGDVINTANALLATDGVTLSGDPNRAPQECVKNILDGINNNQLPFLSWTLGPVEYPDIYPPCEN